MAKISFNPAETELWIHGLNTDNKGQDTICRYVIAAQSTKCLNFTSNYLLFKSEGGDLVVFNDRLVV